MVFFVAEREVGNSVLFFVGESELEEVVGKGTRKSRVGFFAGDLDGDGGGAGSLNEEVAADGDMDAKVLVSAETLGPQSSGRSARGISEILSGCIFT